MISLETLFTTVFPIMMFVAMSPTFGIISRRRIEDFPDAEDYVYAAAVFLVAFVLIVSICLPIVPSWWMNGAVIALGIASCATINGRKSWVLVVISLFHLAGHYAANIA